MTKTTTALAALAVYCLGGAADAEPIDQRVQAEPDGRLEVHNVAGSIEIEGWNRNEVHVTGDLQENAERLDVLSEGDRVIVRVVLPQRSRSWSGGTQLLIRAPRRMSLDVNAVSASVDVRGIEGEQRLASVSGSVTTEAFAEEMDVRSVSGTVRIRGRDENTVTRAGTVSGSVRLDSLSGEVQAESVSGSVEVSGRSIERALLKSVSGHVRLRSGLADDARVEANTTSGSVDLSFRGNGAAEYDLSTFSGRIDNCFGPAAVRSSFGPGTQHRFKEGESRARVYVRTMSGSIDLCRE